MREINEVHIQPIIRKLLSYATSAKSIEREYTFYIQSPLRVLYGYENNEGIIGCIGLEFLNLNKCDIKHIAVSPNHRGEGIGRQMIAFINEKYPLYSFIAETDKEAVNFYKKVGFEILSLGEKYPGVERFQCVLKS